MTVAEHEKKMQAELWKKKAELARKKSREFSGKVIQSAVINKLLSGIKDWKKNPTQGQGLLQTMQL